MSESESMPEQENCSPSLSERPVLALESLAEPLIERCSVLLEEIHTLQRFIKENYLPEVELRAFRSHVQSELRFLKNIGSRSDTGVEEERTQHSLRSSNLGYFELVWAAAKSSSGLCSILTHVHETGLRPSVKQEKAVKSVQVEVIAEDGLQWIKLNAISPKRLMYELAKSGYEGSMDPPSDDDGEDEEPLAEDDESDEWNRNAISSIPLIQHADLLSRAAKNTWVNYHHPKITYLFQNIHLRNSPPPIKTIIKRLQQSGATVYCADDAPKPGSKIISSLHNPPLLKDTLAKFKDRDLYSHISQKLNIDCTILLALASDISNAVVCLTSRKFNRAIISQLKNETHRPLLPSILFPVLTSHSLYCTRTARQRFQEIVDEIGTPTEKARAELILGTISPSLPPSLLREKFQSLCIHPVPADLIFPIITLKEEFFQGPFDLSEKVSSCLTPINQSVFMTGWRLGMTTITSNMAVGKVVEGKWTNCLEEMEKDSGGLHELDNKENEEGKIIKRGPHMWILYTARSLVGKGPRPKSLDEEIQKDNRKDNTHPEHEQEGNFNVDDEDGVNEDEEDEDEDGDGDGGVAIDIDDLVATVGRGCK